MAGHKKKDGSAHLRQVAEELAEVLRTNNHLRHRLNMIDGDGAQALEADGEHGVVFATAGGAVLASLQPIPEDV